MLKHIPHALLARLRLLRSLCSHALLILAKSSKIQSELVHQQSQTKYVLTSTCKVSLESRASN